MRAKTLFTLFGLGLTVVLTACTPGPPTVIVTATSQPAPDSGQRSTTVEEGLPVQFSAPITVDNGSYQWDLGDGTIQVGETISHTYWQEGTYTVIFSAVNGAGSIHSDTITVQVLPYWPTAGWRMSSAENQGMDSALLDQMMAFLIESEAAIDSVIIVRHGYIVLEEYPNPAYGPRTTHLLYSTTKSVTSALIGIAIQRGLIESVDERVVEIFAERTINNLDSRKQTLTVEHLLTMSSGLEWEGPDDRLHTWGQALTSGNPIQFVLDRPMTSEPGTEWYYNGGCSHLLSAILTQAAGHSTLEFAQEHLFEPLGVFNVRWPRDPQGIYYGGQDIWLTPRDMAKFGYLFLRNGEWDSDQILPAEWVTQSSETRFFLGGGMGYGYQWWTFPEMGIYYAAGAYEQRIYIVPDLDLVVVFTADNRVDGERPGEIIGAPPITPELMSRFIMPACDE